MYMAEVLDAVVAKRKLSDPKDYALVVEVGEMKMNIPLDRTVRSLQGKRELLLMKQNMLREYGVEVRERKGTTDPNGASTVLTRAGIRLTIILSLHLHHGRGHSGTVPEQDVRVHERVSGENIPRQGYIAPLTPDAAEIHRVPQSPHVGCAQCACSSHRRRLYPCESTQHCHTCDVHPTRRSYLR